MEVLNDSHAVQGGLAVIDVTIIIAYLIAVLGIGLVVGRRQAGAEEFLHGGRQLPWYLVIASVVATAFSGISLIGVPGYVYRHDCSLLPGVFIGLLTLPVSIFVLKRLRGNRYSTVYEFLEKRFSFPLRALASILFLLTKLSYAAIVV